MDREIVFRLKKTHVSPASPVYPKTKEGVFYSVAVEVGDECIAVEAGRSPLLALAIAIRELPATLDRLGMAPL
jgi:hypothetical protein